MRNLKSVLLIFAMLLVLSVSMHVAALVVWLTALPFNIGMKLVCFAAVSAIAYACYRAIRSKISGLIS